MAFEWLVVDKPITVIGTVSVRSGREDPIDAVYRVSLGAMLTCQLNRLGIKSFGDRSLSGDKKGMPSSGLDPRHTII